MSDHPRFPENMSADAQLAIADEVDILLAGFPSKRSIEVAITAYAENLDGFTPDDIRAGFRAARARAGDFAPTPPQVRDAIGAACAVRRKREEPDAVESEGPLRDLPPEAQKAWRDALGGEPPKRQPVVFVEGIAQEPTATPIAQVVAQLVPKEVAK